MQKRRVPIDLHNEEELKEYDFFIQHLPQNTTNKSIMCLIIAYNNEVRKKENG